jgi:hypothetical protein
VPFPVSFAIVRAGGGSHANFGLTRDLRSSDAKYLNSFSKSNFEVLRSPFEGDFSSRGKPLRLEPVERFSSLGRDHAPLAHGRSAS